MRPFDPRLLRYARATRGLLIVLGLLALAQVATGDLAGVRLSRVVTGVFEEGETLADLTASLVGAAAGRGRPPGGRLPAGEPGRPGRRARVKAELSASVVAQVRRPRPELAGGGAPVEDGRAADVRPRRARRVLRTVPAPAGGTALIVRHRRRSGAGLRRPAECGGRRASRLPLIPLFMVLIGWRTQPNSAGSGMRCRRWAVTSSTSCAGSSR